MKPSTDPLLDKTNYQLKPQSQVRNDASRTAVHSALRTLETSQSSRQARSHANVAAAQRQVSSAPRTIPGRSPVTRKHTRGRKPSATNTTAATLKSKQHKAAAAVAWSEPLTVAEALGRGKLDPNLPPKE
eukprot:COSAG06_NODE_3410_length_5383_cov_180.550530_2_plen_130_part_00